MASQTEKEVRQMVEAVRCLLPDHNIRDAIELLDYREWGEALVLICTQLYEFDVTITDAHYERIQSAAERMELKESEWEFVRQLVRQR